MCNLVKIIHLFFVRKNTNIAPDTLELFYFFEKHCRIIIRRLHLAMSFALSLER